MNNLKTSKKHLLKNQTVPKELSTINTCLSQWSQSLLGLVSGSSRLQERELAAPYSSDLWSQTCSFLSPLPGWISDFGSKASLNTSQPVILKVQLKGFSKIQMSIRHFIATNRPKYHIFLGRSCWPKLDLHKASPKVLVCSERQAPKTSLPGTQAIALYQMPFTET